MLIFEIIGIVVSFLLIVYLALYLPYKMINKDVKTAVTLDDMPALCPKPIPTKHQKSFIRKLLMSVFEVRRWELVDNWHFKLKSGEEIVIPKGFDFDGASIPRPFWALLSPVGLLLIPGLVHDYGYKYGLLWKVEHDGSLVEYSKNKGKKYWDMLFLEIAEEINDFLLVSAIAWLAVSIGGNGAWKKHRKVDEKANKPILASAKQFN